MGTDVDNNGMNELMNECIIVCVCVCFERFPSFSIALVVDNE